MNSLSTDNQIFPICPWCGAELDPEEFKLGTKEDNQFSIEVLCPECNEAVEITASFVYSTYKSDKEIDELIADEIYDDEDDFSYE